MALRDKRLPSWQPAAILCSGLFFLFMGEHGFAHASAAGKLSWLGCLAIAVGTGFRGWTMMQAKADHRRIELVSVICNLGVILALLGYFLTTKSGMSLLGISEAKSIARWEMTMKPLWMILLVVSLLPMILVELTLASSANVGGAGGTVGSANIDSVNLLRVRELASSGLSIALAAAFLMVTCNIADERNVSRDVSYFKTSSAGQATVNMVNSLSEPLQVLLFFPESNEVATEVVGYFDSLASATGKVEVEELDRLIHSSIAREHRVSKEGTIVLVRGDASEKFSIPTDYNTARRKLLREFDSKFQSKLMAVLRDTKTAYFMVGHGELNDPDSAGAISGQDPMLKSTLIKSALEQLNYKTKNYEGFGKPVPDDCSLLFVLAPQVALMGDELLAIDDYLAQGGAAIMSFDPEVKMRLGPLQKRLGVRFNPTPLADDKEFMVQTRTVSDHSLILTNQFLSHASITTMGRADARAAILFVKPGSFDEVDVAPAHPATKKSQIIRTMSTSFRDLASVGTDPNFQFDSATEKRDRYTVAMAIENPEAVPDKLAEGEEHNGMRVILLADREVLSDGILARVAVVQNLLVDTIKWTGGEEAYSGETISEKDELIEHTKSQDTIWFYLTMLAGPLLVLALGLLYIGHRKRRRRKS